MMKRIINVLMVAAALLAGAACNNKVDPEGSGKEEGGGKETSRLAELNGTKISEEANMIGIVADPSGKPIVGVPVTDGYTYVVTDANGDALPLRAKHQDRRGPGH